MLHHFVAKTLVDYLDLSERWISLRVHKKRLARYQSVSQKSNKYAYVTYSYMNATTQQVLVYYLWWVSCTETTYQ